MRDWIRPEDRDPQLTGDRARGEKRLSRETPLGMPRGAPPRPPALHVRSDFGVQIRPTFRPADISETAPIPINFARSRTISHFRQLAIAIACLPACGRRRCTESKRVR